jgi:hypothetical protein
MTTAATIRASSDVAVRRRRSTPNTTADPDLGHAVALAADLPLYTRNPDDLAALSGIEIVSASADA